MDKKHPVPIASTHPPFLEKELLNVKLSLLIVFPCPVTGYMLTESNVLLHLTLPWSDTDTDLMEYFSAICNCTLEGNVVHHFLR